MSSNVELQDNTTPTETTITTDTCITEHSQPLTQTSLDNTSLLEYSSISLCEETSQPISLDTLDPAVCNISMQVC